MVYDANIRLIRIYGFIPVELMLGFNSTYDKGMNLFKNKLRTRGIKAYAAEIINEKMLKKEVNYEVRFVILNKIRMRATEIRLTK